MVQGSILSPHTPYIIYIIYILLLSILLTSLQRYIYSPLFQYEDNQNIYSFIYPTYLLWFSFVVGMRRYSIFIHAFFLWIHVSFCVRRYRYIYLPPWTYPLFGARVHYMVQIQHHIQLNKIRILFNSLPFYMHIYPYTYAYHCIPCIHSTAYHLHLPLKPDYHTMHKRIQARIRPLYTPRPLTSAGARTRHAR